MSQEPWYQDGLKFRCTGCGNCCTGATGAVWVDEQNVAKIAELLDKPIGEIRLMHTRPLQGKISLTEFPNGDCTFFNGKTRGCDIYSVRPPQCRTWPFWNSNLTSEQAWRQTAKDCPGAGVGDLVSLDEIEKRVSVIEL
ncbi:MAG: YkgJ family cysteine cluster protein [Planctomycetaceae bacterium]|nr:YkgJ family cysteine cluster protein [Planctomycetaceae bacterium]